MDKLIHTALNSMHSARLKQATRAKFQRGGLQQRRSRKKRTKRRTSLAGTIGLHHPQSIEDMQDEHLVARPTDLRGYLVCLETARSFCRDLGLIPIFHFTNVDIAPLILSQGLMLSTQGQGDGGIYFSTLSPASYGLGSAEYQDNL